MKKTITTALTAMLFSGNLCAATAFIKDMDGRDYFPLGVNYAWKDWGRDFSDAGWEGRFKVIQADLDAMQKRGVRTLRWWVYTDFTDSPVWKGKGKSLRCTGLPQGWVANFMKVADAAHQRGIRLYPAFSSFDLGRKGFKWVVTDKAVRKSFIENAVRPILKAAGTHPGIFAWDIINEPEWLVSKEDGGDPNKELSDGPVSLKELREYIKDMAAEVHANAKQPVSVGGACIKWCGFEYDFYSGLDLDFFDIHFYDWMTPWFDYTKTPKTAMKLNPEAALKPVMVGESMDDPSLRYTGTNKPMDHLKFLKALLSNGYAGYLPWAWYEKPEWRCDKSIDPYLNKALKELSLPGQPPPAK